MAQSSVKLANLQGRRTLIALSNYRGPLLFFGASNDLLMRGGMPALLLLCYYCVDVIARDGREIARAGPNLRRFALAGVIMVLCVGALTPGIELARAIGDDVAFRYERSGYTTFALPIQWQRQNTAREIPDLLRRLLRKADAGPRREKAEPVVRAGFDVYLNGNERQLVYVKEHCRPDDLESVVLEVIRSDAPPEESVVEMRSMGDACGALRGLPGSAVAAIRTGQRRQGEEGWMVEIRFDEAGRMVGVNRECAYSGEVDHPFRVEADHRIRSSRSPVGAKRRGAVIMPCSDRLGSTRRGVFAWSLR